MTDTDKKTRLLDAFPPHTYAAWRQAAEELLQGKPFEKTLVTPTWEGFELQPIYTREVLERLAQARDLPGSGSGVRGFRAEGYLTAGWLVSQELAAPTPAALNAIALQELAGGQDELNLWLDRPGRCGLDPDAADAAEAGVCGVSAGTVADFRRMLDGVHPEMVSLYLQAGAAAPAVYALLAAALRGSAGDLGKVRGCVGMDPAGWLAATGTPGGDLEAAYDAMAALVRHAALVLPRVQVIDVQGHAYHNAGSSSTQEMAAVLAAAVAYLKALSARGLRPEQVVPRMRLSVSIGGNYFLEIAKLRALRLLWSRVMEAFGVPQEVRAVHVHARTGLWNKTVFDPYVNMLRTTTEAFSAVVGGCDSLCVGPFDEVARESDAFSRRIARNTHAILAEECGLGRVVDPAGGSWAVEALTDQMAAEAWRKFQQIEADGGIIAALQSAKLQDAVEAVRRERAAAIQRRKDVIVGVNAYPNPAEQPLPATPPDYAAARKQRLADLAAWKAGRDNAAVKAALSRAAAARGEERLEALVEAAAAGATLGELHAAAVPGKAAVTAKPLALQRAAGDYERLRLAAMGLARAGKPPVVHQLNMGPSRRYRLRADWTSAFFQVGGFKVLNEDDYKDADAAVAALGKSGAAVAVITADDESYAAVVEPLARAVKAARPGVRLLLAGAPGESEAAWRAAGVDDFVHVRVNTYAFNRSLLQAMGAQVG